jgi:hypothetical protein
LQPVDPIKPTSVVDPSFKPCNSYYPLVPGSERRYTLRHTSGLLSDIIVVVDEAEEEGRKVLVETTQIIDKSGGLEKLEKTVRKFICDGERVQIIYERSNSRVRDMSTDTEFRFRNVPILVVEPAALERKGTVWSYSFRQVFNSPGQPPAAPDASITVNFEAFPSEQTTTPAGKFKALKISRTVNAQKGYDYFAKGVGLIKRVGPDGTTWELTEYAGVRPQE